MQALTLEDSSWTAIDVSQITSWQLLVFHCNDLDNTSDGDSKLAFHFTNMSDNYVRGFVVIVLVLVISFTVATELQQNANRDHNSWDIL